MQNKNVTRRQLLTTTSMGGMVLARAATGSAGVPAILGPLPDKGNGPLVRTARFPHWPSFRGANEKAVIRVLRSGVWSRAKGVGEAETRFAQLMGAKYCVTTCNGTNALIHFRPRSRHWGGG